MLATFTYVFGLVLSVMASAMITYLWMRLRYVEAHVQQQSDVRLINVPINHPDNLRSLSFSTAEKQKEMLEAATRGHNPDQSW